MLKSKLSICDVAFSIEDLVCSPVLSIEDEGKQPYTSMDEICPDSEKCYFKNNIGLKIMPKMGFQGSGLRKHGQGMKEPIKSIWRSKFEGLGFGKRERSDVSHDRSNVSSTTVLNKSYSNKESI